MTVLRTVLQVEFTAAGRGDDAKAAIPSFARPRSPGPFWLCRNGLAGWRRW